MPVALHRHGVLPVAVRSLTSRLAQPVTLATAHPHPRSLFLMPRPSPQLRTRIRACYRAGCLTLILVFVFLSGQKHSESDWPTHIGWVRAFEAVAPLYLAWAALGLALLPFSGSVRNALRLIPGILTSATLSLAGVPALS
jgi:hypothetical protein